MECRRQNVFLVCYVFLLGVFCIASSPLIGTKSVDSEVFWMMGRGAALGKVVYKDLFDHKGIYIFFLNALGYWMDSFAGGAGLFLVEVCLNIVSGIFCLKTAALFLDSSSEQLTAAGLGVMLLFNYFTQQGGNLTETYVSSFQMISVYYIAKYYFGDVYKENSGLGFPPAYMFIHGLNAGICFLFKANYIAMWIPIPVIIGIGILKRGQYRNLFNNIVFGMAGVLTSLAPALFYGIAFDCLEDMYFGMLEFNFLYISGGKSSVIQILATSAGWIIVAAVYSIIMILWVKRDVMTEFKVILVGSFVLSFYFIFSSRYTFGHYYHYFFPFVYPLCIMGAYIIYNKVYMIRNYHIVLAGIFCFTVLINARLPIKVIFDENTSKQKEYSQTMEQMCFYLADKDYEDNILAVGNNVEIYNCLNYVPDIKYFYIPCIDYKVFPDAVKMQEDIILSGKKRYLLMPVKMQGRQQLFPDLSEEKSMDIKYFLQKFYKEVLRINNRKNFDFVLYEKIG